jgi:prepilin-type N-terminal cleavage/methylation domain-containing protein
MKNKSKGFTIIEVLTVLAVISLLIGLLLPALNMARNAARVAKQHVQFTSIEQALFAFRNDYGEYPESNLNINPNDKYCGGMKLAEALLGYDLLGFHPSSAWRADGKDSAGALVYDSTSSANLLQRRPRYLEIEGANAYRLKEVFSNLWMLKNYVDDRYVLCDEFERENDTGVKTGRPILYYRADTSKLAFDLSTYSIYQQSDNYNIIMAAQMTDLMYDKTLIHPLASQNGNYFYNLNYKILDQKVFAATGKPWPHRPDSFILISAGLDGLYGTADDITNFGN